jgi:hypothetical protein
MRTDTAFELLPVPYFFEEHANFLKQRIFEVFFKQKILSKGLYGIQKLKGGVGVVSSIEIVHADDSGNILFAINVVLTLILVQLV